MGEEEGFQNVWRASYEADNVRHTHVSVSTAQSTALMSDNCRFAAFRASTQRDHNTLGVLTPPPSGAHHSHPHKANRMRTPCRSPPS